MQTSRVAQQAIACPSASHSVPSSSKAQLQQKIQLQKALFGGFSQQAQLNNAVRSSRKVSMNAELGQSLEEFLIDATDDTKLRQLMMSMSEAIRTIAYKVRTASCQAQGCINSFGDEQLAVDLVADKLLFEALRYSHVCKYACSEEVPEPVDVGGEGFCVTFDPLDGSSIVDTNFAVGTIFGVWPGDKLTGITGRDQVASGMGVYGPRTVFVMAMKGVPGTQEFLLQDDGKWLLVKETTEIGEGKLFAPGNLRATFDNPEYQKLINYYLTEKYTLRYTGGMVPDVFQIIVKERGVFTNIPSPSTICKLRLLFEVAPLALMVENAGGASSTIDPETGNVVSGLDVEVTECDQRTQITYGSVGEVKRVEEYLYGKSERFAHVAV